MVSFLYYQGGATRSEVDFWEPPMKLDVSTLHQPPAPISHEISPAPYPIVAG